MHDGWELVDKDANGRETLRMAVPGGWLYYVIEFSEDLPGTSAPRPMAQSLVFVPDAAG
jgi:hypothetical protein